MDNSSIPFPDRRACLHYVAKCYESSKTRCDKPFFQQTVAIADRVDALLTDHFMLVVGVILPPQRMIIDSAYCGGLLHAILLTDPYACFESVVDLSNLETARLVGLITPDCRLPRPQRHRELAGRLYDAPLEAQVIKFAELSIQGNEIKTAFKYLGRKDAKQLHRDWLMENIETLSALRKLRDNESFESGWAKLYTELGQLVKICDNHVRREKIRANVAQNHANRRKSPAA